MARIPAEFLNVDVDLRYRTHPSGLIEALSRSLVVTHVGRDGRKHWVRLCFVNPKDPSRAIRRFARLFAKLPKALQRAWHDAASREFDIGIQAGDKPQAADWVLDADAIKEAGRRGARVRITSTHLVVEIASLVVRTGKADKLVCYCRERTKGAVAGVYLFRTARFCLILHVALLAAELHMPRRFFASLLVALALAAAFHVSAAAREPIFLVCEVEDRGDIFIVIENFGGMGGAVRHCVHFWQGHPRGVVP